MQDILGMLHKLHRPRLLIRAARAGANEYKRAQHLKRYLGHTPPPNSGPALLKLMELEAEIDQQRRSELEVYSLVKHVDILIAMMGEARLMRASQSPH